MSETSAKATVDLDTIASLCKRRGFTSTWDYGPLGAELKLNVKRAWWKAMVQERDDIVGIDSAILMSPRVWEASGHTTHFADALVECQGCHKRFRADEVTGSACPECGGALSEP